MFQSLSTHVPREHWVEERKAHHKDRRLLRSGFHWMGGWLEGFYSKWCGISIQFQIVYQYQHIVMGRMRCMVEEREREGMAENGVYSGHINNTFVPFAATHRQGVQVDLSLHRSYELWWA